MTEPDHVVAARADLAAAEAAARAATSALASAADAAADADGDVTVAEAKYDDYMADEDKADWERVAAQVALTKARRVLDRAIGHRKELEEDADAAEARRQAAAEAMDQAIAAPANDQPSQGEDDEALYFADVDEWVRSWLIPTWDRRIDGHRADGEKSFRWAAEWWDHPEAVVRLEALWRAWEHLRRDATTGMSVWLRDHADHHMPILLSKFGPFRRSEDTNDDNEQLPYTAPPPQWRSGPRAAFPASGDGTAAPGGRED